MVASSATACEIVHSEINGVIAGPNADGTFPPSTYPLESVGKRNPSLPDYSDFIVVDLPGVPSR